MSARTVAARRPTGTQPASPRGTQDVSCPCSLVTWYLGLIPHWMGATPSLRARLLLRTHQWIVERIIAPDANLAAAATDLRPDGALTRVLTDLVPAAEASEERRQFIRVVVANLRHALLYPVTQRNEAWVRWLFLIPYSVKGWDADAAGEALPGALAPTLSAAASL